MRRPRVLLAKPGLDGHDRGVKVVAMALRDAGAEVIYLGQRKTADQVLRAAVEEDVDVIGLSILSGSHLPLSADLMDLMKEQEVDIPVVVGGTIPRGDEELLRDLGVESVFPVGTSIDDVVTAVVEIATGVAAATS